MIKEIIYAKNFKKIVVFLFIIFSIIGWGAFGIYNHYYISTDNAYVNANVVQVSPRVTGQVVKLYITNNQYVKQGQPLFDLDPAAFQIALDRASAELMKRQAEWKNASLVAMRTVPLAKKKFVSSQDGDTAQTNLEGAVAAVALAKANLAQTKLDLQFTHVVAPVDGWVASVSLREGDVVTANQPLFALISNDEYWVDANFKETELSSIHPGQPADIVMDMYPGHVFHGVVESISNGSGNVFSLLPPQNATGNWVKVTQRVPVRVRMVAPDADYPLRIGTSAEVTVHLRRGVLG
ncbi:MAG: hypothetical protein A3E83_04395 [Gammaproteobacteria bacterium RIFCSPHIGHO2_12_FULL_41_20]|nr:MAG: hypothetical protein A3E83_04395 [Gammaproteobacteria bacterium RIFCSPHIGHO2_12_FULL_41_20]